jgi:hypothetical protein
VVVQYNRKWETSKEGEWGGKSFHIDRLVISAVYAAEKK